MEDSKIIDLFLARNEDAIRGSVDAVYGMGKVYMKRDIKKDSGVFGLLQSIARMIQEDGEHLYQKRQGIDRKQTQ